MLKQRKVQICSKVLLFCCLWHVAWTLDKVAAIVDAVLQPYVTFQENTARRLPETHHASFGTLGLHTVLARNHPA